MKLRARSLVLSIGFAAVGCAADEPWAITEVGPSPAFANNVSGAYPVLLRDCAFFACHGSNERLFRIWGPARRRLEKLPAGAPPAEEQMLTDLEMRKTYESAISFIDINDPQSSVLLRKGLDEQAGGSGHLGLDNFGRNVYRSAESPGYLTLAHWIFTLQPQAASDE